MSGLFDRQFSTVPATTTLAPSRMTGCHTVVRPLVESLETRLVMAASATEAPLSVTSATLPPASLGGNLQFQTEGTRDHAFADLVKASTGFKNLTGGAAAVDSNGWATEDFTIPLWMNMALDPGQYKISFVGPSTTSVSLSAGAGTLKNVSSSGGSVRNWTLDVPTGTTADKLTLKFTGTAGQVKDLKVLQPGNAAGQVWSTKYVNFLKSLKPDTIRVMDMVKTNYNKTSSWSQRPKTTDATYNKAGAPWEHVIALANELGSNLWVPVPVAASDDYVRQLAALVKANLNPALTAYVEYANETWSTLHEPGKYNLEQAEAEVAANPDSNLAYDGSTNSNNWQYRRNARRLTEIVKLFKEVYTTTFNGTMAQADPVNGRVKAVLGGRASQTARFEDMLKYIDANYGAPKNYFYGIGGAWYFSLNKYRDDLINGNDSLTKEHILEGLSISAGLYESERRFERAANAAAPYGLKLAAYELGADTMGKLNVDAKAAAHADPRIGALMERFVRAFEDQGGVVANWYTIGARRFDLPSGAWTVTDKLSNPDSPKAVAFRNLRAGDENDVPPPPAADIVVSPANLSVPEGNSASFTVKLASQPASNVIVTVSKAADGDADLSTTTTPLTFTPTNWSAAQSVLVAAAQDGDTTAGTALFTLSAAGLSDASLTVTEEDDDAAPPQQDILVSATRVTVPEGGDASFTVELAAQPASIVAVTLAKVGGGDADLTTATASLTFTSTNWNVAQTVTVAAAEDTDATNGAASFSLSSPGLTSKSVGATEADNDGPAVLRAAADTFVRGGTTYAGVNYGANGTMHVKRGSSADTTREAYLRFDLTPVAAAGVGSAKLRLFGKLDSTTNSSVGIAVYESSDTSWGETAITWNNKPATGTTAVGLATVTGTTAKWYEVDVTGLVRQRKAAGATAVTLVVKAPSTSSSFIIFNSDESTAGNPPQLVVAPPPQALVVSTSDVTVPEGGDASFTVKLATAPAADVVVAVAKSSGGDDDLTTRTSSLTFTAANWNVAQTVSVVAAEDDDTTDGAATFTVSSAGLTSKNVGATEADNDTPPPSVEPVTVRAIADAYVRDGSTYQGTNFGTSAQLQVKAGSVGWNRETYLRFDLPQGSAIASAKLRLLGRLDNTSAASAGFDVRSSSDVAWTESGLKWTSKPAISAGALVSGVVAGTTGKWYEVDVTTYLAAQAAAGASAVTLVLTPTAASPSTIVFDSDEATNKPQLVLTPGTASPPPQGLVVSATGITAPEGGSASFTVKLAAEPTADVVVAVAKASGGDGDLTTATASLTFTAANWNVAQSVSVAAAEDTDTTNGAASFTISSAGLTGKTVTATEADNDAPAGPVAIRAAADALVRDGSSYANKNFGTSPQLEIKQGSSNYNRYSYLRFDLSDMSAVSSAKLRLFGKLDNTQASSAGFNVYNSADVTWSETGITWNNKPTAGTTLRGSGTVTGTTGKWYEVDLTAFLQAEKAAGRNVVTLVLRAKAQAAATILFNSDEAATNQPHLLVS